MPLPHCASLLQVEAHEAELPLHTYGAHEGLPVLPAPASASAGQETLEPSQYSVLSHAPAAPRQAVVALARASAGQAALLPLQNSAGSQTPAEPRHWTVDGCMLHVPTLPGTLQASQAPPLHEELQHTPSTQLPLPHWLAAPHAAPLASFGTQAPLALQ